MLEDLYKLVKVNQSLKLLEKNITIIIDENNIKIEGIKSFNQNRQIFDAIENDIYFLKKENKDIEFLIINNEVDISIEKVI